MLCRLTRVLFCKQPFVRLFYIRHFILKPFHILITPLLELSKYLILRGQKTRKWPDQNQRNMYYSAIRTLGEGKKRMDTLGQWTSEINRAHSHWFSGVRTVKEASSSQRPSSTPSRSSMLKKSFHHRPNGRSTVIQLKQTFKSYRSKSFICSCYN